MILKLVVTRSSVSKKLIEPTQRYKLAPMSDVPLPISRVKEKPTTKAKEIGLFLYAVEWNTTRLENILNFKRQSKIAQQYTTCCYHHPENV